MIERFSEYEKIHSKLTNKGKNEQIHRGNIYHTKSTIN